MIQDIAPHRFDNHFEEWEAEGEDFAAVTREDKDGNRIFLVRDEEGGFRFPSMKELWETMPDLPGASFLFSLDGRKLFRTGAERLPLPEGSSASPVFAEGEWLTRRQLRTAVPGHVAFAAVAALSLDGWYRGNVFCSRCGMRLVPDHKERMLKCYDCGNMVYPRISPAVIVGVYKKDMLLMTKYAGGGYRRYALVAGFTEIGETAEETVKREVKEETGLDVHGLRYYKSQPWPFTDTLLLGFFCEAAEGEVHMDDGELALAQWVRRGDIDKVQDGYDNVSLTCEMIKYFRDHPEEFM